MKQGPVVLIVVQMACWFEICGSVWAYKVLFSPLLQGAEGTRVTFLLMYPAVA